MKERNLESDQCRVRWQDGTYDRSRTCSECKGPSCAMPVHEDRYREVITSPIYKDWMSMNNPYGVTEDFDYVESPSANPDVLVDMELEHKSGISEETHLAMTRAFRSLTPLQKKIWQLRMREESITETALAEKLGVSQPSISQALKRAERRVCKYLEEYKNDGVSE